MREEYSADLYLEECRLERIKEFEHDGRIATWAPNQAGPRIWGEEDLAVSLPAIPTVEDDMCTFSPCAVSRDGKLLAVTLGGSIKILNSETLQEVDLFVVDRWVVDMSFINVPPHSPSDVHYALVILSTNALDPMDSPKTVRIWYLDQSGRHLSQSQGIDTTHNGAEDVLYSGDIWEIGLMEASHDGSRVLVIIQIDQDKNDGPQEVVVLNCATMEEVLRLGGHTDYIAWAGWSPNDRIVATAGWDGTLRLWDATTGETKHVIGPTGVQNWCCGFLPDERHIVLTGTGFCAIYDMNTASEVARLSFEHGRSVEMFQSMSVHPTQNLVVLAVERGILLWRPLDANSTLPEGQLMLLLCECDDWMLDDFASLGSLSWADGGKKLIAYGLENTIHVWDMEQDLKWRFQRPQGMVFSGHGPFAFLSKMDYDANIVAVTGDDVVRLWKL